MRTDAAGRPAVDLRAVAALAFPLFLNCVIQAVLNVTDTWFVGRISTQASAALGAAGWPTLIATLLGGCAALGVQSLVAQAYGAGRLPDAARHVWAASAASLALLPIVLAAAWAGPLLFGALGLPEAVAHEAARYWQARLPGTIVSALLWSVAGFFNGIGRTRIDLVLMAVVAALNVPLNEWFVIRLGWGVAGSGWATNLALALGAAIGFALFAGHRGFAEFAPRAGLRLRAADLRAVLAIGFPIGLFYGVDLTGLALFQLMVTRAGPVDGAATQIVMSLTSAAYWPALGIAMAGTTLVGQCMGAGEPAWAQRLGRTIGTITCVYMGAVGLVLALSAPWVLPRFVNAADPDAARVIELGLTIAWIAAAYQAFDGLNLGFGGCLRGAGDVRVPTRLLLAASLGVFLPLTHWLTFAPGEGWVPMASSRGWGAVGGWWAAFAYSVVLGLAMTLRWRSGAWQGVYRHTD
jgi:MATE family multidrug resistance protein